MSAPVVARTRVELAAARAALPGSAAVVMTMGALHAGHARLLARALDLADSVIATIFVNPLQFGPAEDLDRYPRTLEADLALCAEQGVALVFAPSPQEVYPQQPLVTVSPGPLGARLDGASRPGHFDGVLTVVCKLLALTSPDVAVFGEKDAQQLALIRLMVRDLALPVRVEGVPTVRDPDGLALSSRNRFLSAAERAHALALHRALLAGAERAGDGADAALAAAAAVLDASAAAVDVDYLACVAEDDFSDLAGTAAVGAARLLVAARVGGTRLIDNEPVVLGTPAGLKE